MTYRIPTAFFSYTWESEAHKLWVRELGARLRSSAGIGLVLDEWEVRPGDPLPHFMEKAIRESDFVLCVCTPRYKKRFDDREGGAGYEAHIMSAETLAMGNQRKFIPLLREGRLDDSLPSWLLGNRFIDFRGDPYGEASYECLVSTLHGLSLNAPPVRPPAARSDQLAPDSIARQDGYAEFLNAAFRVFEQATSRLVLLSTNNEASRHLLPKVVSDLEQSFQRMKHLVLTFGLHSSEDVKTAAGPIVIAANLAMLFSHHPDLNPKFEEAQSSFNEWLPRFIEATRKEGGLR